MHHILSYCFGSILYHCIYGCVFCMLLFNLVNYVFLFLWTFCIFCFSLCCSVYCLCVNVYCTAATGCQPNCSKQNMSYHIIWKETAKQWRTDRKEGRRQNRNMANTERRGKCWFAKLHCNIFECGSEFFIISTYLTSQVWADRRGDWWRKREGKRSLGRPRHIRKDNIKINLKEIG